jgi:DNA-binding PadR family transcriptional regulator
MVERGLWKATGNKRAHGANEYRWNFDDLRSATAGLHIEVSPLSTVDALKTRKEGTKAKGLRLERQWKYALAFIQKNGPEGFGRKDLTYHVLAREKQHNQGPDRAKRIALKEEGLNPEDHLANDGLLRSLRQDRRLTEAERKCLKKNQSRVDRYLKKLRKRGLIEKLEVQLGRSGCLKYRITKKAEEYLAPPKEDDEAVIDEGDMLPHSTPNGHARGLTAPHSDEADDSEAEVIERLEPASFAPEDRHRQDAQPHSRDADPNQTDEAESVTDPEMIAYFEQQERVMAALRAQEHPQNDAYCE